LNALVGVKPGGWTGEAVTASVAELMAISFELLD
jgi:hypothetical protein